MSRNDDDEGTPGWLQVVIYLVIIAILGTMTKGGGTIGDGNDDDGCSSGVPQMGCFP